MEEEHAFPGCGSGRRFDPGQDLRVGVGQFSVHVGQEVVEELLVRVGVVLGTECGLGRGQDQKRAH